MSLAHDEVFDEIVEDGIVEMRASYKGSLSNKR